jgi:hypothetical protein
VIDATGRLDAAVTDLQEIQRTGEIIVKKTRKLLIS